MSTATRPINNYTHETRGEWEEFRDALLQDPAAREEYERTYRYALFLRQLLQQVEAERRRAGMSKTELARRVGVNPSAMRRLLTAETANPTLKTMLGLFDALGLEVSLTSSRCTAAQGETGVTRAAGRATARAS